MARLSAVLTVTMLTVAAVHLSGTFSWPLLAGVTAWSVINAHPLAAAAAGLETWLVGTGFDAHRFGQLTFTGTDRERLLALIAGAVCVAVGVGVRGALRSSGKPLLHR